MQIYEIPLSPQPQTFTVALGGTDYRLTFYWSTPANCWMLDLADANSNPMVQGIPVITGLDLLYQYKYLSVAGSLVVQTDYDTQAVPTFENLGVTGRVYFVVS
jgi:hypothetical protein